MAHSWMISQYFFFIIFTSFTICQYYCFWRSSFFSFHLLQVESLTDVNGLRTIAFESFKMSFKMIQGKRERHTKLIKVNNVTYKLDIWPFSISGRIPGIETFRISDIQLISNTGYPALARYPAFEISWISELDL